MDSEKLEALEQRVHKISEILGGVCLALLSEPIHSMLPEDVAGQLKAAIKDAVDADC